MGGVSLTTGEQIRLEALREANATIQSINSSYGFRGAGSPEPLRGGDVMLLAQHYAEYLLQGTVPNV